VRKGAVLVQVLGWVLVVSGAATFGHWWWSNEQGDREYREGQLALRDRFHAATTTTRPDPPTEPTAPPKGSPIGVLRIPKIGLDVVVVEGVDQEQLRTAPGHYEETPLGPYGNTPVNMAIAGHRTTYGGPFRHLGELRPGDQIEFEDLNEHRFRAVVTRSFRVSPEDVWVLDQPPPTGSSILTLTTCDPPGSDRYRLVVRARFVGPTPGSRLRFE